MDGAERALEQEFAEYLASVARVVVAPIQATVAEQKAEIDKMLATIASARAELELAFQRQRDFMDQVRERDAAAVAESAANMDEMHASQLSLLESSGRRLIADLKVVSDGAVATAQLVATENKSTRGVIAAHHQVLRKLTDENAATAARIVEDAKGTLDSALADHHQTFDAAANALLLAFTRIAQNVKAVTGDLAATHEETRARLFREFSEYRTSAAAQFDASLEALSLQIAGRLDRRSAEVMAAVKQCIADQYAGELASLRAAIEARMDVLALAEQERVHQLEVAVAKQVAAATQSLAEGRREAIERLSKHLAVVRNLLIATIAIAAAAVAVALRL